MSTIPTATIRTILSEPVARQTSNPASYGASQARNMAEYLFDNDATRPEIVEALDSMIERAEWIKGQLGG